MVADDLAVLQSIFTNFGTTLMSAGLVLMFEPQVRRAVQDFTDEALEEATNKVSRKFDTQLKDLQDQINEGIKDRVNHQDDALEAFSDGTYESALAAMKTAASLGALDQDQITVEGTDEPGEFAVSLALHPLTTSFPEKGVLRIMVDTKGDSTVQTWHPSVPFSELAVSTMGQLVSKKAWGYGQENPWGTVHQRLGYALKLAVKSQREDAGAVHLQGRLAAVIAEGLYLTDKGLECPQHDYILPRTDFPRQLDLASQGHREQPAKPEWADQNSWAYALERCSDRFTTRTLGSTRYPDPTLVPIDPQTPLF
jgi:hypothetical protein